MVFWMRYVGNRFLTTKDTTLCFTTRNYTPKPHRNNDVDPNPLTLTGLNQP